MQHNLRKHCKKNSLVYWDLHIKILLLLALSQILIFNEPVTSLHHAITVITPQFFKPPDRNWKLPICFSHGGLKKWDFTLVKNRKYFQVAEPYAKEKKFDTI